MLLGVTVILYFLKSKWFLVTNSQELPNKFNEHSVTIGLKLADKITCNENSRSYMKHLDSGTNFQMKSITSSQVFSILSKLSKSKGTGLDRIVSLSKRRFCQHGVNQKLV
jgi:hypothetical protein